MHGGSSLQLNTSHSSKAHFMSHSSGPKTFKFTKKRRQQAESARWVVRQDREFEHHSKSQLWKMLPLKNNVWEWNNSFSFEIRISNKQHKKQTEMLLEDTEDLFHSDNQNVSVLLFVLKWNLSKLVYPAEFFNFAESSFVSEKN